MVRMLLGHIGCLLCTSPSVSTVKGLEFTIVSVSARSVLSDSSFKRSSLCVQSRHQEHTLIGIRNTGGEGEGGGVPVPINVKCTNVLKEELNLLMIYFIVCLFQFFLCSHKLEPLSLPNTLFPLCATN